MNKDLALELDEVKKKLAIMLSCIGSLGRLISTHLTQNDERARSRLNVFKDKLDADLDALEDALFDAAKVNAINIKRVTARLRKLIEEELLFYTDNRLRLPDKIADAKCLVEIYTAEPSIAIDIKFQISIWDDLINPLQNEIKMAHMKDLAILSLDIVESTALGPLKHDAKKLAINLVEDYNGRPNPIMTREQGDDEFYAVFDDPVEALEASIAIERQAQEIEDPRSRKNHLVKFRIGLHWGTQIIERCGHCPSDTPAKAVAKRLRDINMNYRKCGLIYCSSEFKSKIFESIGKSSNPAMNDLLQIFYRHVGPFPLKPHERGVREVWEVIWTEDQSTHRPPVAERKRARRSPVRTILPAKTEPRKSLRQSRSK